LVPSLSIHERLRHYFVAMGATENNSDQGTLRFTIGSDRTIVNVLTNADIIERNRIIDTLLHLSSLRSEASLLYVAAPKLLGATLNSEILRSTGIGLLLYDDRRIEECVRPTPDSQSVQINQTVPTSSTDTTLIAELAALKSTCTKLENNLNMMMLEFKSLREGTISTRMIPLSSTETPFNPSHRIEPTLHTGIVSEGLPSFFSNNPWLEVLSKRGRAEGPLLAG